MAKDKQYTWKEIRQAIEFVYGEHSHPDDWGVKVIYKNAMLVYLRAQLNKVK